MPGQREVDAVALCTLVEARDRRRAGETDVEHLFEVDDQRVWNASLRCGFHEQALTGVGEGIGVGEDEGAGEAIHDDAGNDLGLGVCRALPSLVQPPLGYRY
jgi:hypothetical protein